MVHIGYPLSSFETSPDTVPESVVCGHPRITDPNRNPLVVGQRRKHAILSFENDDTDQIHDETARQSRSALGIGLTIR